MIHTEITKKAMKRTLVHVTGNEIKAGFLMCFTLSILLPNGKTIKFLDDNATYLGNQLECEFGGDRCFGIVANMDFVLICTYEENGENPKLIIYKKR